jgi:putative aldouronate transport system permease protein
MYSVSLFISDEVIDIIKKDQPQVRPLARRRKAWFSQLDLMILPGLVYLIINNYLPMIGLVIAFKRPVLGKGILGILGSPWVGLENFVYLFKTQDAMVITRNTVLYNLVFIVLLNLVGVAVGIMLSEVKSRLATKFHQTTILLPQLISIVIIANIVFAFLSGEYGFLNNTVLPALGLPTVNFYTEAKIWPFILTFVYIWKGIGYAAVIYFAAVIGVDRELYEAALVDGANKRQQIFKITLPLLRPTIITLVLLSVGRIFYSDFGLFYQVPMNSGALFNVTNTIDTYVYRALLQLNDISRASAAGFYQSIVGFIVVLITNYAVHKLDPDSALF